jgi:hypothetical protein
VCPVSVDLQSQPAPEVPDGTIDFASELAKKTKFSIRLAIAV